MWNYNFVGLGMVSNMKYSLILGNPKEFYNEIHRVQHFIKFNKIQEEENDDLNMDADDLFA